MFEHLNILGAIVTTIDRHGLHGCYADKQHLADFEATAIPTNLVTLASGREHALENTQPTQYNSLVHQLYDACSGAERNLIGWIIFRVKQTKPSFGSETSTGGGAAMAAFLKYWASEVACFERGTRCAQL